MEVQKIKNNYTIFFGEKNIHLWKFFRWFSCNLFDAFVSKPGVASSVNRSREWQLPSIPSFQVLDMGVEPKIGVFNPQNGWWK